MAENIKTIANLNTLLKNANLSEVTSESNDTFADLPNGFYLSEVTKAELTVSKSSGLPMAALQLKAVDHGVASVIDDRGNSKMQEIEKTKGRMLFKYYVFKDEASVQKFVADMLKFEGETEGEPLLTKEYFTEEELLEEALSVLVGYRLYVQVSSSTKEGVVSTWQNLISWKRAKVLGLS